MLPRNPEALQAEQDLKQTHPVQSWLQSSLYQKPSGTYSALQSFMKGVMGTAALSSDIESTLLGQRTQGNKALHAGLEALDLSLANVDTLGQQGLDFVGNIAGQALSLAPLAAEALAGGAVKVATPLIGAGVRKVAPKLLEKEVPKLTLRGLQKQTLGTLAGTSARYGASFAGFMAPEAIEEAYDPETNAFNWRKASISMTANGALGALIPTGQFLAGLIRGRLGRALVEEVEEKALAVKPSAETPMPQEILKDREKEKFRARVNKAIETGDVTQEEGLWVLKYEENPNIEAIHEEATKLLAKRGQQVDGNQHNVFIKLMTEEDAANLHNSTTDQLFSSLPENEKMAPSQFVIHNRVDEINGKKFVADGLDGWIAHIDKELEKKPEKLAQLDANFATGVREHMEFSQTSILNHLRKLSYEESHASQLPYTIPENIERRVKRDRQIAELEARKTNLEAEMSREAEPFKARFEGTGKAKYEKRVKEVEKKYKGAQRAIDKKIKELQRDVEKILTPLEELHSIRDNLIKEKGLIAKFNSSKYYHRLVDLAHYWPQARRLLDRIHLENAHNAQGVYRNILEAYSKLIKSNLSKFANPEAVKNYLRSRIEQNVTLANLNKEIKGSTIKPGESLEMIDQTPTEAPPPSPKEKKPTGETPEMIEEAKPEVKAEEKKKEAKPKEVLKEEDEAVNKSEAMDSKESYFHAKKKLSQFQKSSKALENLISCVLGAKNGQV